MWGSCLRWGVGSQLRVCPHPWPILIGGDLPLIGPLGRRGALCSGGHRLHPHWRLICPIDASSTFRGAGSVFSPVICSHHSSTNDLYRISVRSLPASLRLFVLAVPLYIWRRSTRASLGLYLVVVCSPSASASGPCSGPASCMYPCFSLLPTPLIVLPR